MTSTSDRLARLRGPVPARRHNARTIAALTGNPGCDRRAVLDSAGVDKSQLAERVGFPTRFGQSRFAITRGNVFEAQLKADGGVELLRLVAARLGVPIDDAEIDEEIDEKTDSEADEETDSEADAEIDAASAGERAAPAGDGTGTGRFDWVDCGAGADPDATRTRHERSRALLTAAVPAGPAAPAALFDHPLLSLEVAGQRVYLEPDLVAARLAGRYHVVEIKSFPVIDGQADPAKVAAAAIQSAVYVLALRELLAAAGHDPELVSADVVLICPQDFANRPVANLVDVRRQLLVLRRQLSRMARVDALLDGVAPDVSFDLTCRSAAELTDSLERVEARYAPECLAACELAYFCRNEARDRTTALGRPVREALGGVVTVAEVLALADGGPPPTAEQAEAAALLRAAARLRAEALA